jgi:hypothetical protein
MYEKSARELVRTRHETCPALSLSMAVRSFYSPRSDNYIKTRGPTSGPKWLAPYTVARYSK